MTERCIGCDSLLPPNGGVESAFSNEDGQYCRDCVDTPRIALVGCGAAKQDLDAGETVPAKELYTSNYFALKREYAETCCDEWRILSAEHGLLDPETKIEAYDASLNPQSDSYIGDYEAGVWAVETAQSISVWTSYKIPYTHYVVLAGEDYVGHRHIEAELERRQHVRFPFRRNDLEGIGDQMNWLRDAIDSYHPPGQSDLEHYAPANGGQR